MNGAFHDLTEFQRGLFGLVVRAFADDGVVNLEHHGHVAAGKMRGDFVHGDLGDVGGRPLIGALMATRFWWSFVWFPVAISSIGRRRPKSVEV